MTSLTTVKTQELRLDVHKSTQHPAMATGVIQANSGAQSPAVRDFLKGSSGAHKGTHQIIGEKIRFGLGSNFNVEAIATAIERGGADGGELVTAFGGEAAPRSALGGTSGAAPLKGGWTWSAEHGNYYRTTNDDIPEWWKAGETESNEEWTWSPETGRYYCLKTDGTYEWYKK